jgi:hypothetical protein
MVFGKNRFSVQLYMDWDKYDDNVEPALILKFNEIEKNSFLPSINAWSFEMGKQEMVDEQLLLYAYQKKKTCNYQGIVTAVEEDGKFVFCKTSAVSPFYNVFVHTCGYCRQIGNSHVPMFEIPLNKKEEFESAMRKMHLLFRIIKK